MGAAGLAVVATGPLVLSEMTKEPFIIPVSEKGSQGHRFSIKKLVFGINQKIETLLGKSKDLGQCFQNQRIKSYQFSVLSF
jgi:hypothetical protein